ncbi:unnamed protein product, partial [Rotaria sp. Silwood2]
MFGSKTRYLVDFLCELQLPDSCRSSLITSLEAYYTGKEAELKILREFERDYVPDKAIWWYTRETFLFRLLNKALRQRNIKLMFQFAFFIQDLYQQLKRAEEDFKILHNPDNTLEVYRGQLMSREEIEKFKEDDDFLINSFFSTTLDRKIALFFISLTDPKEGFERVLLEIKIDIKLHTRPYADISKLHYCKGESEVLFMIGTKLKLRSKKPYWNENEKIWIIQLELCPIQQDSEKNKVPDESMRKSLKKHVNKLLNPWLYVVLEPKDMQEIFNALVDFYPNETWIDATRIHCQAKILQWRFENFYEALELYDEALYKWTLYLEDEEIDCMADIAELEANFAECYRENTMFANMHYDSAISYYKLALEKETNQEEKMNIYYKMSSVYEAKIQACSYDEDNEKDREEK